MRAMEMSRRERFDADAAADGPRQVAHEDRQLLTARRETARDPEPELPGVEALPCAITARVAGAGEERDQSREVAHRVEHLGGPRHAVARRARHEVADEQGVGRHAGELPAERDET